MVLGKKTASLLFHFCSAITFRAKMSHSTTKPKNSIRFLPWASPNGSTWITAMRDWSDFFSGPFGIFGRAVFSFWNRKSGAPTATEKRRENLRYDVHFFLFGSSKDLYARKFVFNPYVPVIFPQADMKATYNSIEFVPEMFEEYLLSADVGFESCEKLDLPSESAVTAGKCFLVFSSVVQYTYRLLLRLYLKSVHVFFRFQQRHFRAQEACSRLDFVWVWAIFVPRNEETAGRQYLRDCGRKCLFQCSKCFFVLFSLLFWFLPKMFLKWLYRVRSWTVLREEKFSLSKFLITQLIDWSFDWSFDWCCLVDWLIDLFFGWFSYQSTDWLVDWWDIFMHGFPAAGWLSLEICIPAVATTPERYIITNSSIQILAILSLLHSYYSVYFAFVSRYGIHGYVNVVSSPLTATLPGSVRNSARLN